METKAISIAKLTPVGIAVFLATGIFSLSLSTNHAAAEGNITTAGNMTAAGGGTGNMTKAGASNATSLSSSNSLRAIPGLYGENR
jgi:hypothetical protein